jgi:ATP-dependent exoDNAse (exonuclease V) alpha subunit
MHRLQGVRFPADTRVHMHLDDEMFDKGQVYVALSRGRTLAQVQIHALAHERLCASTTNGCIAYPRFRHERLADITDDWPTDI